ncbi:MAG TPA: hypothetical protein VKX45_23185 [Bryobacteraceae bacterium]|nr:hypothetical protein [Bryobacteraceae bacterium]
MSARGLSAAYVDPRLLEIDRIVESPAFHSSESLCRLLRYLANRTVADPGATIREHEIAAEVFGRSDGFDPRIDSTVRVNVARLRARLIDYYSGPGSGDPMVVELPKGTYGVAFHPPASKPPRAVWEPAGLQEPHVSPSTRRRFPGVTTTRLLAVGFTAMTVVAMLLAAALLLEHAGRRSAPAAPVIENRYLRQFWGMLLEGSSEPWVVFSNATFVGRPSTGMRYLVPSRDSGREVLDLYTGIGEVLGIHALDHAFVRLNRSMRVKRGGLLSLDDVQNNDVVYVGSPLENLTLRDVPGLQDFEFKIMEDGVRRGEGVLVNRQPRPGEPPQYVPSGFPLTEDFAVIALVPGLNPARWALILAGTSTLGTQGAAEFVCREDTVRELLHRMGATNGGVRPFFEAVLDVQIKGGVPVHSNLVAFHKRRSS